MTVVELAELEEEIESLRSELTKKPPINLPNLFRVFGGSDREDSISLNQFLQIAQSQFHVDFDRRCAMQLFRSVGKQREWLTKQEFSQLFRPASLSPALQPLVDEDLVEKEYKSLAEQKLNARNDYLLTSQRKSLDMLGEL